MLEDVAKIFHFENRTPLLTRDLHGYEAVMDVA